MYFIETKRKTGLAMGSAGYTLNLRLGDLASLSSGKGVASCMEDQGLTQLWTPKLWITSEQEAVFSFPL